MKRVARRAIALLLIFCATVAGADEGDLSLTFVGDIMAHDVNYRMKDFNDIYAEVKALFAADDLTFGNLEFPVVEGLPYATFPTFNVHRDYVRAAIRAGFDVFALANNHSRDKGEQGALDTLASLIVLKEEMRGGLYYSGVRGDPAQPFAPALIRKKGYRVGFLAVTQFLNIGQARPYVNVVDYKDRAAAARFIEWVKSIAGNYDILILSYHGDIEFQPKPDPGKQAFFRALVRAGVHIVWGHHPHVLQPYEQIDVNGSRRLIMYSMGNFVSGMAYPFPPARPGSTRASVADSMILPVRVTWGKDGNAGVNAQTPVLITTYRKPDNDVVVKKLEAIAATETREAWKKYLQARLVIVRKFLADMPLYLHPEAIAPGRTAE
jgi:poly-gamma-glutamate capsule biosynthesis protein CapA/YwtB (metallophosphatase superfamily)